MRLESGRPNASGENGSLPVVAAPPLSPVLLGPLLMPRAIDPIVIGVELEDDAIGGRPCF